MGWIVIVPGLAVRRYASAAAAELRRRGHRVDLLRAPGWRGTPADVRRYGELLAADISKRTNSGMPMPGVVVGLSIGTEAAAVAARHLPHLPYLLLVSPTVDPMRRSWPRLLRAFFFGSEGPQGPGTRTHLPDWAHAGIARILLGMRGALRVQLERELPGVGAEVTIVHAEHDPLTTREWAAELAAHAGARFVPLDDQPHSWPYGDEKRFADLIERMLP